MHLGVLFSSVALAPLVAATNNVRDVDPCAQIAKAASDAQGKSEDRPSRTMQLELT